jgi:hypothetical protein
LTAEEYLRDVSSSMTDLVDRGRLAVGGSSTIGSTANRQLPTANDSPADCVVHAEAIARLLLDEHRAPWIGRIRDVSTSGDSTFHGPLMPLRLKGTVWNTHYVACSAGEVYDPLIGQPVEIASYATAVFGKELAVEICLDAAETERLLRSGELRRALTPSRGAAPSRT